MPRANAILSAISPGDSAALRPHLRTVHLESKNVLFQAGDKIETVYFPTDAVISLVIGLSTGEVTESAMVGNDGLVGASSALDGKIAINSAVVQLPGEAMVCDANAFKGAGSPSGDSASRVVAPKVAATDTGRSILRRRTCRLL